MNFEKIKDLISNAGKNDLPTAAAAFIGALLVFIMFKTTKIFMKLALLLVALALFAGAYWWHLHK